MLLHRGAAAAWAACMLAVEGFDHLLVARELVFVAGKRVLNLSRVECDETGGDSAAGRSRLRGLGRHPEVRVYTRSRRGRMNGKLPRVLGI